MLFLNTGLDVQVIRVKCFTRLLGQNHPLKCLYEQEDPDDDQKRVNEAIKFASRYGAIQPTADKSEYKDQR